MPFIDKAQELRDEKLQTVHRMREIVDNPAGDGGTLTSEQDAEFDRLHAKQEELQAAIDDIVAADTKRQERLASLEDIERELTSSRGVRAGRADTREIDAELENRLEDKPAETYERAFDKWMRNGVTELDAEERRVLRANYAPEERAQSVGQDIKGGFLVPEGPLQAIIRARLQFGGLRRSRALSITTSTGNDLPWPTYDDTSNKGRLLSENAAVSTTDITLGQSVLHAYAYSSDFVKVGWQLLQDSEVDLDGLIFSALGERIERKFAEHATTGDGAAKPFGVVNLASTGKTAANTTDILYDELLDLKHAVDPAYREGAEWMFNDATLKYFKQLKDGEGRPLWQPGMAVDEPNTIDGDPYVINIEMASIASAASAVLYGDFSSVIIRDVAGPRMLRLDERFADNGQVAFLLFSRHDSLYVNAGQNPIQKLVLA